MSEYEKRILDELEKSVNTALVRLCSVQVCGPGVVAMAGAMEEVNRAIEKLQVLRDELGREGAV